MKVCYKMDQPNVLEEFLAKVEELSLHISQNRLILEEKKKVLSSKRAKHKEAQAKLKTLQLKMSRTEYENTHIRYLQKQYQHDLDILTDLCAKQQEKLRHLQQRRHSLETKQGQYKSMRDDVKASWDQFIEGQVRAEAEESQKHLSVQNEIVKSLEKELEEMKQRNELQEEELDVLIVEKTEQQELYARLQAEWRKKHQQLIALNRKRIDTTSRSAKGTEFKTVSQLMAEMQ